MGGSCWVTWAHVAYCLKIEIYNKECYLDAVAEALRHEGYTLSTVNVQLRCW